MTNTKFLYPFFTGILGLIAIITSKIVELSKGQKIVEIAWAASASIMLATLIMKYYSIDTAKFTKVINETNPSDHQLEPKIYINWITNAMIIGFFATITIHFNFIAGMIVYLLMQLCLIKAFSGIFVINPKLVFKEPVFKKVAITSAVFWILYVAIVYTFFVYSGPDSLVVIPYIIFLGIMAHISWYGLVYDRTTLFRYMIVLASAVFVYSDSLIGNEVFGENKVNSNLFHTIDMTYVLNIFLMSQAILFLKDKSGQSILKE